MKKIFTNKVTKNNIYTNDIFIKKISLTLTACILLFSGIFLFLENNVLTEVNVGIRTCTDAEYNNVGKCYDIYSKKFEKIFNIKIIPSADLKLKSKRVKLLEFTKIIEQKILANNLLITLFLYSTAAFLILFFWIASVSHAIIKKLNIKIDDYNLVVSNKEREIKRAFDYDKITNTLNRNGMEAHIDSLLSVKTNFKVVVIDIKRFKNINDLYGFSFGNKVINAFCDRMKEKLNKDIVISRLGGDEFCIVVPTEKTVGIMLCCLDLENESIKCEGKSLNLEINTGVSYSYKDGSDAHELIANAVFALNFNKNSEKNISEFSREAKNKRRDDVELETKLIDNINNPKFEMFYQPQVNNKGVIIGAESLIRWPEEGSDKYISPAIFIPIAEKLGLSALLDRWVIKEVFKNIKTIEGAEDISFSINISTASLCDFKIVDVLKASVKEFKVKNTSKIIIEITEGTFISNFNKASHVLDDIKKLGFRVSIDDFGTGYSSLSYLAEISPDEIKIDQSFIRKMDCPKIRKLISAIFAMGKDLGAEIVAEGVESIGSIIDLKENDCCNIFQGFYFYKPMNKADFEKALKNKKENKNV